MSKPAFIVAGPCMELPHFNRAHSLIICDVCGGFCCYVTRRIVSHEKSIYSFLTEKGVILLKVYYYFIVPAPLNHLMLHF